MNDDPRAEANWEGLPDGTEHRTTGGRAWCFQDSEWCYERSLCLCCDTTLVPLLYRGSYTAEALRDVAEKVRALPPFGANKSRDAGRGYAQAIQDVLDTLRGEPPHEYR